MMAGKRLTGHSARLADELLWAYVAGGVSDDHNAFTTQEVIDRHRLGLMITVMAGSMNDNVPLVFEDVAAVAGGFDHFTFCADDRHVEDLQDHGHIDHHVRTAIAHGVPVIEAYRMATLNAAAYYRLDHLLGSLTPTRLADLMILDDLADVRPTTVIVNGEVAAEGGAALFPNPDHLPDWCRNTVRLHPDLGSESFRVPADAAADEVAVVRAMEMYDGYFKRAFEAELPVVDGNVLADPSIDVAKIAVVDRHHGTRTQAMGFVRGFGLRRGALGITSNCENQNLVVVGTSDAELAHAAQALADIGGGYVAVADGEVLATVPLPYGGIMSDQPWEVVYDQSVAANHAARSARLRDAVAVHDHGVRGPGRRSRLRPHRARTDRHLHPGVHTGGDVLPVPPARAPRRPLMIRPLLGAAIAPPPLRPEEESSIDSLQQVIDGSIGPAAAEVDASGRYPTAAVAALKTCDILHLAVPTEFGGRGAGHVASLEAQCRLAAADSAVAQVFKVHDELVREIFAFVPRSCGPASPKPSSSSA